MAPARLCSVTLLGVYCALAAMHPWPVQAPAVEGGTRVDTPDSNGSYSAAHYSTSGADAITVTPAAPRRLRVGGSCANRGATERKVRFWLIGNQVSPASPPENGTAAAGHCKPYLLSNLTRYQDAIGSLGIYSWSVQNHTVVDADPSFWIDHKKHTVADPGFWPCIREIRQKFPHIKLGAVGSGDDGEFVWAAQHPKQFGEAVRVWVASHEGLVDEMWTDWEPNWDKTGLMPPNGTGSAPLQRCTASSASLRCRTLRGINAAHAAMQAVVPTVAYAHCGPYWETTAKGKVPPPGYVVGGAWTESCAELADSAPGVTVQASNTYRDDTVSSGESGGFERLLLQEIADITDDGRSPHNLQRLSPAICPDCPTGNSSATDLTMTELYEREWRRHSDHS